MKKNRNQSVFVWMTKAAMERHEYFFLSFLKYIATTSEFNLGCGYENQKESLRPQLYLWD